MDELEQQPAEQTQAATPVDELTQKCEDYLAGWRRAQADYANLKRERDAERHEVSKYANERLLNELLPAIDQFEMAMNYLPDLSNLANTERKKIENWLVGMKAVRSMWENTFQNIGLEKVNTDGMFDPNMHEAVGQEERPDLAEGSIIRTMQAGWKLSAHLLRPAKVIVSTNESSKEIEL